MDTFTKRYTIGLVLALTLSAAYFFLSRDPRLEDINAKLASDHELADYPYQFKVLELTKGIATVSSPRSAQVPVMRFLRTAFPELGATPVLHPDMMAAQDTLVSKQARAEALVRREPDVETVRWALDERWFNEHGVFLNLRP